MMPDSQLDYRAIRRRVEAGLERQKRNSQIAAVVAHVILFVLLVGLAWFVDWIHGTAFLFILGWLVGLLMHIVATRVSLGKNNSEIRDRLFQQELQAEILRLGLTEDVEEKAKRVMRLSDDGELLDVVEDRLAAASDRSTQESGRDGG